MSLQTVRLTDLLMIGAAVGLGLTVFAVFSIWSWRFGSEAVQRWAAARGLQVVYARRRSLGPHWPLLSSRRFQFFRVTLRDADGVNHRAWMRLESDCSEPKVIDVIWDDKDRSP